jgi:hypothetical protein
LSGGFALLRFTVPLLFFIILLLGYAFSLWVGIYWVVDIWRIAKGWPQPSDFLQEFLDSIEVLLLCPVPAITSTVVFHSLYRIIGRTPFSKPDEQASSSAVQKDNGHHNEEKNSSSEQVEENMALAKRLLVGIIVTVAGTRMLGELLGEREPRLIVYYCGAILIISLAAFVGIALRKSNR